MTMGAALRRLGFASDKMTAHGFRAMARTMLVERLNYEEATIEAQLAHRVRDALGRAYNRTQFVDQRRAMMQAWGTYLDELKTGKTTEGPQLDLAKRLQRSQSRPKRACKLGSNV